MKYNMKRVISIALIIMLIISTFVIADNEEIIKKDETVYVSLNNNGTVDSITVVNRLFDIMGYEIRDFGEYENIKSLSENIKPIIKGNELTWYRDSDSGKDFYYEGTIDKELPINFEVTYYLDDEEINSDEIAGKSGELKIKFGVKQNKKVSDIHKNAYLTQIQFPVDLKKVRIKDAPKAMKIVTGTNATISYSVMPDADDNFTLILDVIDFEMESIQVSLISYDAIISGEYNELIDGLVEMEDGMNEINKGTVELGNGLNELVDGVKKLKNGLVELNNGGKDLEKGFKEYQTGLKEFNGGVITASGGLNEATSGLSQLNQNSDQIISGYSELYMGLSGLQQGHEQLVLIAQSLLQSSDPNMRTLGQGIIEENEGLKNILGGFSQANDGLNGYFTNLNTVFNGINEANKGISELKNGSSELTSAYDKMVSQSKGFFGGLNSSTNATINMYNSIKTIPQDVNKLKDGQIEVRKGITEMIEGFENDYDSSKSENIYSFVDNSIKINSIQFIMVTPEIKMIEISEEIDIEVKEEDSAWYKKIWSRIINLFK